MATAGEPVTGELVAGREAAVPSSTAEGLVDARAPSGVELGAELGAGGRGACSASGRGAACSPGGGAGILGGPSRRGAALGSGGGASILGGVGPTCSELHPREGALSPLLVVENSRQWAPGELSDLPPAGCSASPSLRYRRCAPTFALSTCNVRRPLHRGSVCFSTSRSRALPRPRFLHASNTCSSPSSATQPPGSLCSPDTC